MDKLFSKLQNFFPFKINLLLLISLFLTLFILWGFYSIRTFRSLQSLSDLLSQTALLQKRSSLPTLQDRIPLLESLSFLIPEQDRIAALSAQFPDNSALRERLLFLANDQNHIHFNHARFSHPVQMNEADLRNLLALLHQTQITIKRFDLLKRYEQGEETVYSIDMELQS